MKTLVKEWSFWAIIAIYAVALTVAVIQVNAVVCIWICAAAFWQTRYMLKEVFAHELIKDNLFQLIARAQVSSEKFELKIENIQLKIAEHKRKIRRKRHFTRLRNCHVKKF